MVDKVHVNDLIRNSQICVSLILGPPIIIFYLTNGQGALKRSLFLFIDVLTRSGQILPLSWDVELRYSEKWGPSEYLWVYPLTSSSPTLNILTWDLSELSQSLRVKYINTAASLRFKLREDQHLQVTRFIRPVSNMK